MMILYCISLIQRLFFTKEKSKRLKGSRKTKYQVIMKKIFLMIAMLGISFGTFAQNYSQTETKEDAGQSSEGDNAFQLACNLSRYGYANKNALSLIQAAQIVKENGFERKAMEKPTETSDGGKESGEKSGSKIELDAAKLLADAKALANGDQNLLGVIASVEKSQTRGAVGGWWYDYGTVSAYSTVQYSINFRAGERAVVAVSGDGDTDLDLYVYDGNGNLIGSDTDYTDDCVVAWYPRWTGTFYIRIKNRGGVYNRYYFRTN